MRRRTPVSISTHTRSAAAAAVVLMLGASACAQSGTTTRSAAVQEGTSENPTFNEYVSPIATFMGVDFQSDDQQDVYIAAERDRIDWLTACMAKQGFEHHSVDPTVWFDPGSAQPEGPAWGSKEWVSTYGFGVSTQMFEQEIVGTDLVGNSYQGYDYVDPNEEYVNALSDVEQQAYWIALGGDNSYDWDTSLSDEENSAAAEKYFETVVETGCEPLSYEQMPGADPYQQMYDAFSDELGSMYERVESDPEMLAKVAQISRCAADAGYDYTNEQDTQEDLYRRVEPVQNEMTWPSDGMDESDWEALTDEGRQELQNQLPTLSAAGKAMLAEVQQYEVELATAVYACGFGDLINLHQDIMVRYEEQFIDAHRADLESMRTT